MIPLFKVSMSPGIGQDLEKVLQSGYVGQGEKVNEFEERLKSHIGTQFINTVNSGTSGLTLALRLAKQGDRDEVITTPLTCTATNWAILANGLKIKWADINPHDLNIDVQDVARKITPKTLAIMVVHWGGYACDLRKLAELQDICQRTYGFSPVIIEDCAHTWDAKYEGKNIGTHGNFAVFSFQAIKHFSTADGGLLVSPDLLSHKRATLLRWYGLDRNSSFDFRCEQNIQEWGYKFHMNDVNATIGLNNLNSASQNVKTHKENAAYFNQELNNINGLQLTQLEKNRESSYWVYSILVENKSDFCKKLKTSGIMTSMVHARNDRHVCIKESTAILPGMDEVSEKLICIPCGWWVSQKDREHIVETIKSGW